MTEKRLTQRKEIKRHSVNSERYCTLRAVSCRDLNCTDQQVKIVDLSITGIGVECDRPLEPGIVWFKESVYGQKCGHIVWQKKNGSRYRVGVEFISLSRLEEDYLRQQLEPVAQGTAMQDPQEIIPKVLAAVSSDRAPAVNRA